MTDGLDQALANTGLNLLRADTSLTVHDGAVPAGAARPYIVVYTHIEWPAGAAGDALDGIAGSPVIRWYVHGVGDNAVAARAMQQRARTQLLNQRPVVAGMDLGLIRQESSTPPQRDETTGSVVMDAVAVYRLSATT